MRLFVLAAGLVATLAGPALAEDLQFTLINESSHAIVEMFLSPTHEDHWGENILSVPSVDPGTEGTIDITDGEAVCDYDMRFVTAEGSTLEATQNMCELASFTVTD